MTWLKVAGNNNTCELCGEKIMFRNVYAPDAPPVLPLTEFIALLFPRVKGYVDLAFNLSVRLIIWFLILPLFCVWWLKVCELFNHTPHLLITHLYTAHTHMRSFFVWWIVGLGNIIFNRLLYKNTLKAIVAVYKVNIQYLHYCMHVNDLCMSGVDAQR